MLQVADNIVHSIFQKTATVKKSMASLGKRKVQLGYRELNWLSFYINKSGCVFIGHTHLTNAVFYNIVACVYGDPHIVTLDGYKYTFNGRGEFFLIQTPDNRFTLQGRMVPAVDNETVDVEATVFSALAARERYSSMVQFQLTEDEMSIEMLVDGELVDFSNERELEFGNVTVINVGNNALSALFSSGVFIEARASNGFLSTVLTSLSSSYRGSTQGLMGNFNGDTADDLIPRGEVVGIPLNSTLRDIHIYGLSCEDMRGMSYNICR